MKKFIKSINKISIISVLIISILMISTGSLYFRSEYLKTSFDKANYGSYHLTELSGYGTPIDMILANNDQTTYGWCINKGANLYGGEGYVYEIVSAYDSPNARSGMSGQLTWLYDNIVRYGSGVTDDEIAAYKKNIQNMMDANNIAGNINDYSTYDIFANEQYAIWSMTNNVSGDIPYPTLNPIYNALKAEAAKHTSYTHSDTSVTVDKSDVEVSSNGAVGPFHVSITGIATLSSNLGDIYKDANFSSTLASGEQYTGDVYLKTTDTTHVTATISWSYYTTTAKRYNTAGNPGDYEDQDFVVISRTKSSDSVTHEEDLIIDGAFDIELVKYEKGKTIKLPGAEFKVEISDLDYSDTKTTGNDGKASFSKATISEAGRYHVVVTETRAPGGYIGLSSPIEFDVSTVQDGNTFKLVADHSITVDNAKLVDVEEGKIKIEAENRTTSVDIHKGVKTVDNQDSGYFAVEKAIKEAEAKQAEEDANRETTYEDEKSGKEYSEVELEELQHEWVVETTIPEAVSNYNRYLVNDPIDTSKLDFSGLDRVKVELIDARGNVTKTLVKDTDYKTKYENNILTVTYIDKKDGNNFFGAFLSTATTSNKIRLTFNTTFKVNPETGKLVVLEGTITNAENRATLRYDNGNGTDVDKLSEKPEVHTGAVSVFKYEDTNNNGKHDEGEKALVGAEFKIALSKEDAEKGKFVKIGGKELVAISNEDGIATFTGLSFGGDAKDDEENLKNGLYGYDWEKASRDYYIVETKSPDGYKKLDEVIKVTVSKDSSEIIDLTDKINEMESVANLPLKFDLALRKWVTHAIVIENGKTVDFDTGHHAEDDPEAIVKVDLKKSKLNNVVVKFRYSIRVTNEGEIAGEAREVTDYIPEGLKFVQEDNPNWTTTENERVVKTRLLEGVVLEPGESAEVEILLTWVNSESNMGVMTNTAEISEDYNEYGVHDIDSTPNNKVWGEDDIDDAPVMITVKTGSDAVRYVTLGLTFMGIITLGAVEIKRKILS